MALALHLATATANVAVDAVAALLNNGFLDIYDGTQPATANTAISTQVKLAHLGLGATAFAAASGGVATASAIASDTSADATGTAAWFRAYASNGTTTILDGSVGVSGADLNLVTVSIVSGNTIGVSALTLTQPLS